MSYKKYFGMPCKGGKYQLLDILLPLIKYLAQETPYRAFLDVCGGGGKLACNIARKYLFPKVLYNEYERGMAALMACLTDETLTKNVIKLIDRLIKLNDSCNAEVIFNAAKDQRDQKGLNKTVAAAYTFYCIYASYANNRQTFNKDKEIEYLHNKRIHKHLLQYPSRIKQMLVTCGSCFDVLERYADYDDIISFIDPPYYETNTYKTIWTIKEYDRLKEILSRTKNKVILCGRENDRKVYDCLLEQGWTRTSLGYVSKSSNCHDGSLSEEFIWTNFIVPKFIVHLVEKKNEKKNWEKILCSEIN